MKTVRSSFLNNLSYLTIFLFSVLILFFPSHLPLQLFSNSSLPFNLQTSAFFLPNYKTLLLVLFVFILLCLFLVGSYRRRKLLFRPTLLNWLLIVFAVFSASLCFFFPNSLDLLLPFTALPLILLLIPSLISPKNSRSFIFFLNIFGLLTAVFSLVSLFTHLYPYTFSFSPTLLNHIISPLETAFILIISLVTLSALYFKKGRFSQPLFIFSLPCLILGLIAAATTIIIQYNSEQLLLLSPQESLQITLNTLENKTPLTSQSLFAYRTPLTEIDSDLPPSAVQFPSPPPVSSLSNLLFGHPSHSYSDAYLQHRSAISAQNPASNQLIFTQGFGSFLTLVPIAGVVCLIILLALFFQTWKLLLTAYSHSPQTKSTSQSFLLLLPLVTLFSFFFLPLTPLLVFATALIFSLVLSFNQSLFSQTRHLRPPKILLCTISGLIFLISLWSLITYFRIFQAQTLYQSNLEILNSSSYNNLNQLLSNNRRALKLAPQLDFLHRQHSVLKFQSFETEIAPNAIFTNDLFPPSALEALAAAQNAVQANSHNSQNWQLLGATYQQLVPYSSNYLPFLQLSANAYLQALALNPYNLELHSNLIDLFLFQLHQPSIAIELLQSFLDFQPNSSSAYQKLAIAHLATDNKPAAYQAFQTALSLLDRQSPQYQQDFQAIQTQLLEINLN